MSDLSNFIDDLVAARCVLLHIDTARNLAREIHDLFAPRIAELKASRDEELLKSNRLFLDSRERRLSAEIETRDRIISRISALFGSTPESFVAVGELVDQPELTRAVKTVRFTKARAAVRRLLGMAAP